MAIVVALTSGCAADKPKPAPLEPLTATLGVATAWTARVGNIEFPLSVPSVPGRFVVADSAGAVVEFDAATGAQRWRAEVGSRVAAGVGSDGRFVAVVTRDNEVVVVESAQVRWRQRVPSRVVTPPLVAGERVFVLAVDRSVHAFDAVDGRRLWQFARPGDALTLAQPGVLMAARNQLLVGQGGRLVALDPLRGTVAWDVPLATPRGSNEVERLADLVGPAVRLGDRVCARAFQNAVGCVDLARPSVAWTRNHAGATPLGGNAERVFGGDGSGRLTAWATSNGETLWTNERLLHRGLTGGLALPATVVFADREGWVHFLSAADGKLQARVVTEDKPVVAAPVRDGSTLLVVNRSGGLFALRTH